MHFHTDVRERRSKCFSTSVISLKFGIHVWRATIFLFQPYISLHTYTSFIGFHTILPSCSSFPSFFSTLTTFISYIILFDSVSPILMMFNVAEIDLECPNICSSRLDPAQTRYVCIRPFSIDIVMAKLSIYVYSSCRMSFITTNKYRRRRRQTEWLSLASSHRSLAIV